MWIVLLFLSCTILLANGFGYYEILGKGQWVVQALLQCEDAEQYEVQLGYNRKKINRTHDAFDIIMELDREVNFTYGLKIDAYRKVDGGFKFFQSISDDCVCTFLAKNAEENWKRALSLGNIDPPDCPFGPGPIDIQNFVMDYTELAKTGVYGTYMGYLYVTLGEKKLCCAKFIVSFDKQTDEDSDEDDYD